MHQLQRIAATVLVLALAAAARGGEGARPQVGVLWTTNSSMTDRTFLAFSKELAVCAPAIELEVRGKLKTLDEAAAIYARWQAEKAAVVFLRSEGAAYMRDHPPQVPGFFGVCNDPVELGALAHPQAPEGKLTGCTYAVPAAKQVAVWRTLWPGLARIGLLVEHAHPGAKIDADGLSAACAAAGIALSPYAAKNRDDVAIGVRALVADGAQLIVLGSQQLIFDQAGMVPGLAGAVPVASLSDKPVRARHAMLGLIADDAWLGAQLARQVAAVVAAGKPVAEVPVVYDPRPRLIYAPAKVAAAGVSIPAEMAAEAVRIE